MDMTCGAKQASRHKGETGVAARGNSPQFIQERFRGFQIGSFEALAELRVNSCE